MPPAILFVCHANRCRSPLAAALLRRLLDEQPGTAGWRVESAGLHAESGQPATAWTQDAAQAAGLDLSRHRSQSVDDLQLADFDLIFTLEEIQAEALVAAYPHLAARIRPFGSLIGLHIDVADPTLEGNQAAHRALVNMLARYLKAGLPNLVATLQAAQDQTP